MVKTKIRRWTPGSKPGTSPSPIPLATKKKKKKKAKAKPPPKPKPKPPPPTKKKKKGPKFDLETIKFVATIIADFDKELPERSLRRLAVQALEKDKIGDKEWIEKKIKLWKPDPELPQFRFIDRKIFEQEYGEASIDFLLARLNEPSQMSPKWASHFMNAVQGIGGIEVVGSQEDVYSYVTQHPDWKTFKKARKLYKKKKDRVIRI